MIYILLIKCIRVFIDIETSKYKVVDIDRIINQLYYEEILEQAETEEQ